MRPLKLTVQAFGPFAGRHEIDFQRVSAAPLFGFYGATGSGKTSVLDAICFALFGESSGGERDRETLRSDYATLEQDSFVSLLFSVGQKRYFIHRIPEYEKKKLRGTGTTAQKHEAVLFDITGMNPADVVLDTNPGVLLAEKKITLVQEKITEILGYNASQFRQVVMLPQGKFRDFLTANSKARSEILRQLFDLSFYESLEARLKQKSKALKEDIVMVASERQGILQTTGLETIEAVHAVQAEKSKHLASLKGKIADQDKLLKAARKSLEDSRKTDELFVKLEQAKAEQKGLDLQRNDIQQSRLALEGCKKAMAMGRDAENLFHSRAEKEGSEKSLFDMAQQRKQAEQRFKELDIIFQESSARQSERDGYQAAILQAKQFLEILASQEPLKKALKTVQTEKEAQEKALTTLVAEHKKSNKALGQAQEAMQQLKIDQMEQASLNNRILLLKTQVGHFLSLEKKREQVTQTHQKIVQADKDWAQAGQDFDRLERRFKMVEQDYHAARAALLAQGLKKGEACPVCGGLDHPLPAQFEQQQNGISDEAYRDAREAREQASQKLFECANALKQLENRLEDIEREHKVMELEAQDFADGVTSSVMLKKQLASQVRLLKKLEKAIAQGLEQSQASAGLEKKTMDLATQLEQLQHSLDEVTKDCIRKEAQASAALQDIPEPLQEQDALKQHLAQVIAQHDKAEADHTKTVTDRQQSETQFRSAQDQEKSLQAALETRLKAFERAKQAFATQLVAQGFGTEQDYHDALLEPDTLAEAETAIKDYEQKQKIVEEQKNRYMTLIGKQDRPDLTQPEQALAGQKVIVDGFQKEFTQTEGDLKRLSQTERHYAEKTKLFEGLDQRYRRAQTLSDIANGTGDNQRKIRLVDWLLSSYFDDVLAQANIRFTKMTRQQFRLHRKLDIGKGRGVSGLDIEVYDDWSGKSRPSVSLSGGESFLAALALALGLSDVVQQESGGVVLEAIFIDEGFGHLDEEALDQALNVLTNLSGHNKSVGIISHVEEVKRRVPAGFDIISSHNGSKIQPRAF